MSVLGNRPMWLFVFFDLPVNNNKQKKMATRFRHDLIKDGYFMIQYSIYACPCKDFSYLEKHKMHLKNLIPPQGSVRALMVTDRQFAKMEEFINPKKFEEEKTYQNTDDVLFF